jgi:hypothetical protein
MPRSRRHSDKNLLPTNCRMKLASPTGSFRGEAGGSNAPASNPEIRSMRGGMKRPRQ